MTATKYDTLTQAHGALCLDVGFDPFEQGGMTDDSGRRWRKVSARALAALGYPIRTAAERREEEAERARLPEMQVFCWATDCGGREGDGDLWDYDADLVWPLPPDASEHQRRYSYQYCRVEKLGRISARSREEARRILHERWGHLASRITFS